MVAAALGGCGARGAPTVTLDRPARSVAAATLLGGALDGHSGGETAQIYTPANVHKMLSAGLGPVSYRLRTELGSEAWHFNARGTWSDGARHQGYWTSADTGPRQAASYGYRLPRRGNTIDQANDDGYSRIDDGAPSTFWKSNPYLDPLYTREPDARHPQWLAIDLGAPTPIDAVEIDWARDEPYARRLHVQLWRGTQPPWRDGGEDENRRFSGTPSGGWQDFPTGAAAGRPGRQVIPLLPPSSSPSPIRYLRILLDDSSHTGPPRSRDRRDRLGFAVAELRAGRLAAGRGGLAADAVRHARSHAQSIVWTSSTDPWHRAGDRDRGVEQPGFDTVAASGLTRGRPMLVPLALAYGTPPDAAAELRYLRRRGIAVAGAELGEEPDGQLLGPEDYGALYDEFARALRAHAPPTRVGGPSLATALPDWTVAPGPAPGAGQRSWIRRFLDELGRRHAGRELSFFSFELYPFDDVCAAPGPQLAGLPHLVDALLARIRADGVPASMPLHITEYGWSPFAARAEADLPGALADADIAARFAARTGQTSYVYGYEPDVLIRESTRCDTWGNLALLLADDAHRVLGPLAAFHAMRLLTTRWLGEEGGAATLFAPEELGPTLTAYPARRPDGHVAVALVNRSLTRGARVRLAIGRAAWDRFELSPATYVWHPRGPAGHAAPDLPPARSTVGPRATVALAPASLTVVVAR